MFLKKHCINLKVSFCSRGPSCAEKLASSMAAKKCIQLLQHRGPKIPFLSLPHGLGFGIGFASLKLYLGMLAGQEKALKR